MSCADDATLAIVMGLIKRVARDFKVSAFDILSKRRDLHIVAARWAAVALVAKAFRRASYPQLAKWFRRHHTSIIHVLDRMGVRHQGRKSAPHEGFALAKSARVLERAAA